MIEILKLSVITASLSYTLSETRVFKPLRDWAMEKHRLSGNLLSCGYCLAHWIAFLLVVVYQPRVLQRYLWLDYFLTVLIIAWLAAIQWVAMCWFMKRADK